MMTPGLNGNAFPSTNLDEFLGAQAGGFIGAEA